MNTLQPPPSRQWLGYTSVVLAVLLLVITGIIASILYKSGQRISALATNTPGLEVSTKGDVLAEHRYRNESN